MRLGWEREYALKTVDGRNGSYSSFMGDNIPRKLVLSRGGNALDVLVDATGLTPQRIDKFIQSGITNEQLFALGRVYINTNGFDKLGQVVAPQNLDDALLKGADAKRFVDDLLQSHGSANKAGLREVFDEAVGSNLATRVKVWKSLNDAGRVELKFKKEALEAFEKVATNPKLINIGITFEDIAKIKGATGLAYHEILNNLDNFGKNIAGKNITIQDFSKLMSDLYEGNGKSDGANWVVKYLGSHAADFEGATLKFEAYYSNSLGGRYVDVSDVTINSEKIFYEFKSVGTVPPGDFTEQFMKDLTNASSLDQIKWMFNGAKNPPNFQQNMMNAIDNLPLTQQLADKLLAGVSNPTVAKLRQEIINQFGGIFKLNN